MAYIIENGIWNSVFAVPSEIVDKHLKLCGATSLKVLLVLLRAGAPMEPASLAERLSLPVIDIQDAMNYWVHLGVIRQNHAPGENAKQPVPTLEYEEVFEKPARPKEEKPAAPAEIVKLTASRYKLTTAEINEMANADENIAYLLQETQAVLGKPLTPVATDTVVSLYSYYGMQPDLILMLVHYCVSSGKDNMRYIEKVAATWLEKGIDSHEKAEREIVCATKEQKEETKIKKLFGIYDRALVPAEKAYIRTWLNEYKMSAALIQLAYERTVELKGKLSFAYINGILSNWHKSGIATPAQAVKDFRKNAAPKTAAEKGSSYDIKELEEMIEGGRAVKRG